jgi:hypothetical protein
VTGLVRAVACRLRRRHRPVGVVLGETVVVVCPRCRTGTEVPLVVPAGTPPPPETLTVARAVEMGCVLVDGYTFLELQLTAQVERAFAAVDEPW